MNLNQEEQVNSQNLAENQHQPTRSPEQNTDDIILLEEKVKIDRRKQKVGEVIISKKIETRMVQVPVRKEKLIVEKIGKHPERIAEVVVGEEKVNGFKFSDLIDANTLHITKSNFVSLETAEKILADLHSLSTTANTKVRLEIVTNSSQQQIEQQAICDRYSE